MTKKLILIDGSGFIFRAFHALPPLRRPDGIPVGAVYGFCNMLWKFLEQAKSDTDPDYIAVIFDAGRQTFRQQIYTEYKSHRPEVPADLIPQFALIRQACDAFNIPAIELEGFEADDLIASYAVAAHKEGMQTIVVSSDKDLMQLVNSHVSMFDPLKNKTINAAEVVEKFGVDPLKVIDVQALAGDASDNVPGVPGIGVKTAAELINQFGTLENLLAEAHTIKQPKRRQMLTEHAEMARISKQLVTLCETVPLPAPITAFAVNEAPPFQLTNFLREQGFSSLAARLDNKAKANGEITAVKTNYQTIRTQDQLAAFIKEAQGQTVIAFDTETTSLNAVAAELVGISMSLVSGSGVYIPLNHREATPQLPMDDVLAQLHPLLTNPAILKVGHNLKYDLVVLKKYQVQLSPISDTMLMSYVLDGSRHGHGMDELAERHLQHKTIKYSEITGTGKAQKRFDEVAIEIASEYAAEDADITLRLYHFLAPRLAREQMMTVYERIERPIIQVIADMEARGIKVDQQLLFRIGQEFTKEMQRLELEIYQLAGRQFNVGSPKQLGEILFDELNMPASKKSKTGAYVTDADTLEKLVAQGFDLPRKVLEWRGLAKLNSTYVEGLLAAVNPKTQRVHTSYSMAVTATGRLSSSDPNLQNIPVRTEKGRLIRQAFITEPGWQLMSLDYSQIELRLLAHFADVPELVKAFHEGQDIHATTAAHMFGGEVGDVTSDMRRRAKAINFGIIYGISAFGLSQQLSIPQEEASRYIKQYFERYPGIQDYMERMKHVARDQGYVKTLFGRKCYALGIGDKNAAMRQFAERQAINAPLQGSNADIIKQAMERVFEALTQHQLTARLLLQVHDELVFEVPDGEIEQTAKLLKEMMENIVQLKVPLVVGVGIGVNWDQAH